jgi:AcrR family transcriptional regulator
MPRGFTPFEKDNIRRALMQKGKTTFSAYGLRKTNVEELATSVGISKGAFYLFFDSKEELFFEILQQAEAEVRQRLLGAIDEPGLVGQERFRTMLKQVVVLWRTNPLFAQVNKDVYEQLLRKLPPEKTAAHIQDDIAFAHEFVEHWRQAGVEIGVDPALVSELIRSLFFLCLHEHEFGADMFQPVIDVLIDGIVQHVVQEQVQS